MAWFEGFEGALHAAGDVELFARTGGKRAGPPVLLLHGYPETHVMWQRVAQRLAADFSLVIPDLRGYGDSTKPAPAATPELDHAQHSKRAMAADLAALMRSLGHERFAVVGHDRGGRVAHRLALDHPERVARLAVIDIAPTLDMYEATDMRFASWYYHWFFLIQPAPLPERMIGGDPAFYLHWTLGGWGTNGHRLHRARGAGRIRALLLPRRRDPCRVRGLPRLGVDRPRARPGLARRRREGRLRDARPLGRARHHRPLVRSARDLAGAVRGAGLRPGDGGGPLHPRRAARRDGGAAARVPASLSRASRDRPRVAPGRGLPSRHFAAGARMFQWINRLDPYFPIRYSAWVAVHVRLRGGHARLVAHGDARVAGDLLPRPGPGRLARRAAEAPRDPAQLSGDRPSALPARVRPAGDAPVLHRERQRGRPFLAPAALARLPARQGRLRQAPVRHADERADHRLRVDQPLDAADDAEDARLPDHDRRRPRPALQREPVQHLGDELRLALGQRDPGAQRRRQAGQLRARHRRGLDQPPSPRPRRRPDLGDRLGLLRLLRRRRQLLARNASPPMRATRRSR